MKYWPVDPFSPSGFHLEARAAIAFQLMIAHGTSVPDAFSYADSFVETCEQRGEIQPAASYLHAHRAEGRAHAERAEAQYRRAKELQEREAA